MPECGSQITICDLPIRYDTYKGCSHACTYCFVMRKVDISNIGFGESAKSLESFILGNRSVKTKWCDWKIPIHWGGMSDPFQPVERKFQRSLKALEIFAKYKYPFVVSTKSVLLLEEPYWSLLMQCNCVVQFSASCPEMNDAEKGAATFQQRVEAARKISQAGKRVVIRVQPYIPALFKSVVKSIDLFHDAGVYGVIFESMKYIKKVPGTIKTGNDFVYPTDLLKKHFAIFKDMLHKRGMKFYSGENRLRAMGDSLCCCGIDGLEGFRGNSANLNHFLYDKPGYVFTDRMKEENTAQVFTTLHQTAIEDRNLRGKSFFEVMKMHQRKQYIVSLVPDGTKLD